MNRKNVFAICLSVLYLIIIIATFYLMFNAITNSNIKNQFNENLVLIPIIFILGYLFKGIYNKSIVSVCKFNSYEFEIDKINRSVASIFNLLLDISMVISILIFICKLTNFENSYIYLSMAIIVVILICALISTYCFNSSEEDASKIRSDEENKLNNEMYTFKHFAHRIYFQYTIAFTCAIIFGVMGFILIKSNHDIAGSVFTGTTIVSLVGLFIDRQKDSN